MAVNQSELRVQLGTQSSFGTAVTPTVALRGVSSFDIEPGLDAEMLEDMSLGLAGSNTPHINMSSAAGKLSGWASYEQFPYLLDNLFGTATPSGAGPYDRQWAAPTTTRPTPRLLTLVLSDSAVGGYGLTGALITKLSFDVMRNKVVEYDADLIGFQVFPRTLATLATPTVTPISGNDVTRFTWDAFGGDIGTTELETCKVVKASFEIDAKRSLKHCLGQVGPNDYRTEPWEGSCDLALEFDSTTKTQVSNMIGGNLWQRLIELTFRKGTDNTLVMGFAGSVLDVPKLFDYEDGIVTVSPQLSRTYEPGFANWFRATLGNTVATLA